MKKKLVLIIEDDKAVLKALTEGLDGSEFSTVGAKTGKEGIALIKKENPDIILLDLIMPEMTGEEVLEALNKDGITERIPILVLTNKDDDDAVDSCLKMGAKEYLLKANFSLESLTKKMKEYC